MGLANLLRPPPGEDGWQEYWFNNWIDHQDIQQGIQKNLGINQTIYVIDPWITQDANGILQRHQQYHNDMNAALDLNGSDLSTLNLKDPQAILGWAFTHWQEHQAAHAALGF